MARSTWRRAPHRLSARSAPLYTESLRSRKPIPGCCRLEAWRWIRAGAGTSSGPVASGDQGHSRRWRTPHAARRLSSLGPRSLRGAGRCRQAHGCLPGARGRVPGATATPGGPARLGHGPPMPLPRLPFRFPAGRCAAAPRERVIHSGARGGATDPRAPASWVCVAAGNVAPPTGRSCRRNVWRPGVVGARRNSRGGWLVAGALKFEVRQASPLWGRPLFGL
jgi:hypothetical protein